MCPLGPGCTSTWIRREGWSSPAVTGRPVSSTVSRSAASHGSSPWSMWPPGCSHSESRLWRCNTTPASLVDSLVTIAEAVLTHIPQHRNNHTCVLDIADVEYPIGLNLLEDTHPDARAVVADAVVAAMRSIWHESWGPRLETILRHSVTALIETPNASLVLLPKLLTDVAFRQKIVSRVSDPFTRNFFMQQFDTWRDAFRDEAIVSVLNKVEGFLAFPHIRNILGQGRSTLHLEQAMSRGRIVVVNLSKTQIGETAARLTGALILANIVSKLSLSQGRDFHLLIDEAHNFGGTQAIAVLLQEARKFGVSVAVVTQHLAALNEATRAALLGNAHTLVCYRVGPEDAALLAPSFDRAHQPFNPYTLTHLDRGEAVIRIGASEASHVTIPVPQRSGCNVAAIKKQSRLHYGRPRDQVERNIFKALGAERPAV